MHFQFEDDHPEEKLLVIKPRRNKSISSFTLRLTSMIDMFTILLVFLLKSFSLEGEIISVARDLQLPESSATTQPRPSPILIVTSDWLILDGNPLVRVNNVLSEERNSIPELSTGLKHIRSFSEELALLDQQLQFKGELTIQGDRQIPFELLKKIMFTCGQHGFNNLLLAVHQEEQG